MAEGTWVGLDVHARKTVAGVLDASTGEVAESAGADAAGGDGRVVAAVPGAGAGRLRGGSDRVRACACVRGGGDRVHGGGAVEDPARAGGQGEDGSS